MQCRGSSGNNVQSAFYWSATTIAENSTFAWVVNFGNGNMDDLNKFNVSHVWYVRGGMNADAYYGARRTGLARRAGKAGKAGGDWFRRGRGTVPVGAVPGHPGTSAQGLN